MSAPKVNIAVFGAAHGVKGELRLKSFTQNPADFTRYGPLSDAAGARAFAIEAARLIRDDLFIVRVAGLRDRAGAEALNGVALYAPRSALPPPDEDEFYHADLIGLEARGVDGSAMGIVRGVLNFGAGDILEISRSGGGEMLLPFTKACAPTIDFANGRIIVVAPQEVEAREDAAKPNS